MGNHAKRMPKPPTMVKALRRLSRSAKMAAGIWRTLVRRAGRALTKPIWALLAPSARA